MESTRIVAGLDVHKDSVFLCIMEGSGTLIFQNKYSTLTPELRQMCQDMLRHGVTEAAMESTAVYWVPVWNELYDHMSLKLANPLFIKQLPGRKSDVRDAQWIAECLLKDLIRDSFVPSPIVQDMRKLNRRIVDLNKELVYNTNKLDACMQRCGFKLSNYVTHINGKAYQRVLKLLIEGETDPGNLIKEVHPMTIKKNGYETILAAITGKYTKSDLCLFGQIWSMLRLIEAQIEECHHELLALCQEHFPEQFKLLMGVPGIRERSASAILAETGGDMEHFQTASKLVGWCGLRPRNDESNGKIKRKEITHGNKYLRMILIQIAWGASRTKDCFFSRFHYLQTVVKKKNRMKILVAVARKMLITVWHIIKKKEAYQDYYLKQLEKMKGRTETKPGILNPI